MIRAFEPADWPGVWAVLEPVFRAGETFPHDPAIDSDAARQAWVEAVAVTFVATEAGGAILGTYYLRPNQPCLGAHVANAGYVVAEAARGRGVGHALCRHSQEEARRRGFTAMQFNLVVSTNTAGVAAWSRNGFCTIGRLPGAFRHPRLGAVDALVMFKTLA
ncbi:GNAT family N-acetyltransferase [Cyanobium sp. Cruz CV13-4-11]|jgi:GNAT superfamily N-acetyltransferase|uniref:GNAT family N-acetyltransferase n=1 Tax=unclassified Cyanobium TaxID=2627006 RepID=UPI0020CF5099|nr:MULTISPECIES: GNAT family N-acetyltransferase [unclassified Cyanobium]MCP9899474.1 GNAT family N-acetyltransferase [Cyanobium sp. Cruz CV11-17]MCP9918779.1 GNAT family N-acetyltransferase [Cyanobium sp. Cruz CV13-4-11]